MVHPPPHADYRAGYPPPGGPHMPPPMMRGMPPSPQGYRGRGVFPPRPGFRGRGFYDGGYRHRLPWEGGPLNVDGRPQEGDSRDREYSDDYA